MGPPSNRLECSGLPHRRPRRSKLTWPRGLALPGMSLPEHGLAADLRPDAIWGPAVPVLSAGPDVARRGLDPRPIRCSQHEDREVRRRRVRDVPIFAELRPYLADAFKVAEPDAVYVVARYRGKTASDINLGQQAHRIIRLSGLQPCERTFHNLRASRQTELSEQYPAHVVCAWMGNTETVARDHYT